MNTIYHSLRKSDLVEALFELRDDSSEFKKVLSMPSMPDFQTCVLSLRQTFPEIMEIIEEYVKCNHPDFTPDYIEYKKSQFPTLKEIKEVIIQYFCSYQRFDIRILGPYKEEELEIMKNLKVPGNQWDDQNHYFVFGESLDPANIQKLLLDSNCDLYNNIAEPEFKNIFVLYHQSKFSADYFRTYPDKNFFYPRGIESKKSEVKERLELALAGIDEACSLEPKTFEDILTFNQAYEKTKEKARIFSKIDRPILIIGKTHFERENLARLIHNESPNSTPDNFISLNSSISKSRKLGEIFSILLSFLSPTSRVIKSLMNEGTKADGYTPDGDNHPKVKDLINILKDVTVFVDNVEYLSEDDQSDLFDIIAVKLSKHSHGDERSKLKFIFGATSLARLNRINPDLQLAISDVILNIPTLQERGCEDIKRNTNFIIEQINKLFNNNDAGSDTLKISFSFTKNGLQLMCNYTWPRNDLELSRFVKKVFTEASTDILSGERNISANGEIIITEDIVREMLKMVKPLDFPDETSPKDAKDKSEQPDNKFGHLYKVDLSTVDDLEKFLDQIEKDYLEMAIKKFGKNQSKIGRAIGYTQPKVFRRMNALDIM